jgi:hypothetical protein
MIVDLHTLARGGAIRFDKDWLRTRLKQLD